MMHLYDMVGSTPLFADLDPNVVEAVTAAALNSDGFPEQLSGGSR